MSNVGIAESSMEICLQNMPYEILYEIFRSISKFKLVEISKLCSKFRDIAGDRRFWKNVYIKYGSKEPPRMTFAFEELYSEPWPVKVIDLTYAEVGTIHNQLSVSGISPALLGMNVYLHINRPVCSQTDQEVKVTKLILSLFTNDKVTIEAILTKYQCTELHLSPRLGPRCYNGNHFPPGLEPKALLKQTSLEVLSLSGIMSNRHCHHWLTPALNYCKQLKTLDLRDTVSVHRDTLSFVGNLPTSLEKLFFPWNNSDFSGVFNLLAEKTPNLRELGFIYSPLARCSSPHKFQFLEILHFYWFLSDDRRFSDLDMYLIKFPALKTVSIVVHYLVNLEISNLEKFRRKLELHGIVARVIKYPQRRPILEGPVNDNLWEVSKTV